MKSDAPTVASYLASLPDDRRADISKVRAVIRKNLPKGIVETMDWGMIAYQVPLSVYPKTYNGKPLMFAALASQKNCMAVYLSAIYENGARRDRFEAEYRATGKRLDVGKSCVRFKQLHDLPLDVIGDAIASFDMDQLVAMYDAR